MRVAARVGVVLSVCAICVLSLVGLVALAARLPDAVRAYPHWFVAAALCLVVFIVCVVVLEEGSES